MEALVGIYVRRMGQGAGWLIDPPVLVAAFDGITALRPLALHPFEIGESRAILVLVDHPRR